MKDMENTLDKPILLSNREYRALSPIARKIADYLKDHKQVIVEGEHVS